MHELDDGALELRLRHVLTERLGSLPLGLTAEELERRRRAHVQGRARRRPLIVLGLAAALLVPVGWLAAGAPLPRPTADTAPKEFAATFARPFEYVIPAGSAIRQLGLGPLREEVAWVDGPARSPEPSPEDVNPGQQPKPEDVRGVIVGSAEQAWSHGTRGRFMLRTAPAEFLSDLRDTANVDMGTIQETTLDGRPALTVRLSGAGGYDIHVTGSIQQLSQDYVLLTMRSRLTVADIDGTTVFILAWARTPADLDAWLPVADELIASIHFIPVTQP